MTSEDVLIHHRADCPDQRCATNAMRKQWACDFHQGMAATLAMLSQVGWINSAGALFLNRSADPDDAAPVYRLVVEP